MSNENLQLEKAPSGDKIMQYSKLFFPISLQGGDAEKLTSLMAAMSFEAAQVQIKMRYDREDSLLHIGLEKVRNLRSLVLKPNRQL